jgi:hypothetical protein
MSHALVAVRHDGRRPSVTPGLKVEKSKKPRSGDRQLAPMVAAHAATAICRPFRAGREIASVSWGSRPRLSICRRFAAWRNGGLPHHVGSRPRLVLVQKRRFLAISSSDCGFPCAAYSSTPPRKSLSS